MNSSRGKFSNDYLYWIALILLSALAYYETFIWLFNRFTAQDSYYSHGFLIPLISIYIIWKKSGSVENQQCVYNWWDPAVLVAGLVLHAIGTAVHIFFISGISLFIYIFGLSIYLFGIKATQTFLFPICFLIFMIPLPLSIVSAILLPMKEIVLTISAEIIRWMRIPITVDGFNIYLENCTIIIGNPCSGLRSLISFTAMGALIGYFSSLNSLYISLMIVLSVPVAIITNILRTIFLILTAEYFSIDIIYPGHWFHTFIGIVVFLAGMGTMITFSKVIQCQRFHFD